jgi:hypothetical protein
LNRVIYEVTLKTNAVSYITTVNVDASEEAFANIVKQALDRILEEDGINLTGLTFVKTIVIG